MISATEETRPRRTWREMLRDERFALQGAALYLLFFTAMTVFNAHPPQMSAHWAAVWGVAALLTTAGYLIVLVLTIGMLCRRQRTARLETLLMVCSLFLFLVLNPAVQDVTMELLKGKSLGVIFSAMSGDVKLPPVLAVVVPFLLILTGTFFGQLLSRIIRERSLLVPVALISGLIDLWGVYWGPVSAMSDSAPAAVSSMATAATAAAQVPDAMRDAMPSSMAYLASIAPPDSIGIGDFVFIAFFLACAYRLKFSARNTMWGIFLGLLAASFIMSLDGISIFGYEIAVQYLPGLLFICGGVLLANWKAWQMTRTEWGMTGALVGILLLLIGYSVYRAEMDKPREGGRTHIISAVSADAVIRKAITAAAEERGDRASMDLLIVYAAYENNVPLQWQALCVSRERRVTVRSTREYILTGTALRAEGKWDVREEWATPPNNVLGLLAASGNRAKSEKAALAGVRGLPMERLHWLADAPRLTGNKQFMLNINPNGALLMDAKGRLLKQLETTATAKPAINTK